MDTAFKVVYSLVVAILLVLVVILGMRTFYEEPDHIGFMVDEERKDYFRNVFIIANAIGVVAISAGLFLFFRRVEAMPLGLLLGGTGVVIYGWVELGRGPGESVGTAPLFAIAAVGLAIVLAAGYWFLGRRPATGGGG